MRLTLFSVFACLILPSLHAQEPDTTWVQTFTWEEQNNPQTAYDSPGRRWFEFPSSSNDSVYQKVLMYYNLKCFEDGTAGGLGYACGEWDYLTYTYLFDHTGMLDSNLLSHPHWLIEDLGFIEDTLIMEPIETPMDTVRSIYPAYSLIVSQSLEGPTSEDSISSNALSWLADMGSRKGRMQWIWTATELEQLGWDSSEVYGLQLPALSGLSEERDAAQWKLYWTDVDSLSQFHEGVPDAICWVSNAMSPGEYIFDAPLSWDGASHLVVELLLDVAEVEWSTEWGGQSAPQKTWQAGTAGEYVHFDGNDRMEVSVDTLNEIETAVTVEFWQRGTPEFQPENNSICEGMNASNQREINIHLPWSNGRVYWDAGYDGGYDRIDQAANQNNYEGVWNHWAFSKDAITGSMSIYLNGALWHSGSDKDNLFGEMVRFHIGCNGNGGNDYRGDVDEFRMWSEALSPETIAQFHNRPATTDHPNWESLLVEISMDHDEVIGNIGDSNGIYVHGNAGAKAYDAKEAFWMAGEMPQSLRPNVTWLSGNWQPSDSVIVDHAKRISPVSVVEYAVQGNAVGWESLSYGWPVDQIKVTQMASGEVLATYPIEGESTVFLNDTLTYFSAPFEVVDRYELARYITPYGIGLTLGDDGWTWIFDVSDYAHLLRDSVELQAGNWQELLDMKFAFIEGTPPRDVKRMEAFWKGQYNLNSFDGNVVDHVFTPQPGESMFRLKTRASGHGFGSGNNCAEFCYNTHSVQVDGNTEWSWEIMRECADNALYPQGGTWIYDRAGWCPGAVVDTKDFELTPLVEGQESFAVDYDITYDPDGNYRFEGQIVAYGPPNMQYDVEIAQILAPSDDKLESRWNPICESPKVLIRNNGSSPLTSCTFTYSIEGGQEFTFNWEGELQFLQSEEVELPFDEPLLWEGDDEEWVQFNVQVNQPNGMNDEEPRNNSASSRFHRVPTWSYPELDDNRLIVWTKTNSVPWETNVELLDAQGNVVWERGYPTANTTYRDTLALNQGCYRFTINDLGDDGQSFWANSDGSGYTRLKKVAGGNFINFEPDFGKFISQAFFFQTNVPASTIDLPESIPTMVVFPNPSDGNFQVKLSGFQSGQTCHWRCYDQMGRIVKSGSWVQSGAFLQQLDMRDAAAGTYAVICYTESGQKLSQWVQKQ
ncbi:MAG: peptide-N-glycosidase F-related protein [Bacteroidetes bacterium]|nr:peptide-N-glycosidase F-related protein [Bacteroidota bacterium]MDA1335257.1 peptide-N-glycosidase F-related protein [Bacteroidota bacterium]